MENLVDSARFIFIADTIGPQVIETGSYWSKSHWSGSYWFINHWNRILLVHNSLEPDPIGSCHKSLNPNPIGSQVIGTDFIGAQLIEWGSDPIGSKVIETGSYWFTINWNRILLVHKSSDPDPNGSQLIWPGPYWFKINESESCWSRSHWNQIFLVHKS